MSVDPQDPKFPTHSDRQFDPETLFYHKQTDRELARPLSGERLNMAVIRDKNSRLITYISRTRMRTVIISRVDTGEEPAREMWFVMHASELPLDTQAELATGDLMGQSVEDTLSRDGRPMFHMSEMPDHMTVLDFNTNYGALGSSIR